MKLVGPDFRGFKAVGSLKAAVEAPRQFVRARFPRLEGPGFIEGRSPLSGADRPCRFPRSQSVASLKQVESVRAIGHGAEFFTASGCGYIEGAAARGARSPAPVFPQSYGCGFIEVSMSAARASRASGFPTASRLWLH